MHRLTHDDGEGGGGAVDRSPNKNSNNNKRNSKFLLGSIVVLLVCVAWHVMLHVNVRLFGEVTCADYGASYIPYVKEWELKCSQREKGSLLVERTHASLEQALQTRNCGTSS